jgi:hypothetical protein
VALLFGLALEAACGPDSRTDIPRSLSPVEVPGEGEGPLPEWDNPLVNGVDVATRDEAAAELAFDPVVPKSLPPSDRMLMTDPEAGGVSKEHLAFALIYNHPEYGRFQVIERVSQTSQEELESLATTCDPAKGCEGEWTLVDLRDGLRALSIRGPVATAIIWLESGIRFDVAGPSETFTKEASIAVANSL